MAAKPKNGSANRSSREGFVGMYLAPELKAKLSRLAKADNRSLSNMIEVLLTQALEYRRLMSENGEKQQKVKMWGDESADAIEQPTD